MLFHKNELKEFNKKFNEPYGEISNTGKYNTILSKNYCLGMNSQKTSRNNNVLVLGRVNPDHEKNFVEPNLLQANRSYVVIDSDELYEKYKDFFNKEGYTIKVFNLIDMEHSNYYNPFRYIKSDLDILHFVFGIMQSFREPKDLKSPEALLLLSICFLLIKHRNQEDQNIMSVRKILKEVEPENKNEKSTIDCIFDDIEKDNSESIALKYYKSFKLCSDEKRKHATLILDEILESIEDITKTDNIELEKLGDEKQILFIKKPPADDTYNFIIAILIKQAMSILMYHANECKNGYYITKVSEKKFMQTEEEADNYIKVNPDWEKRKISYATLANHCHFMLMDFTDLGKIPEFTKDMVVIRKYNISCSLFVSNIEQLEKIYDDTHTFGITEACNTILFLGSANQKTNEWIAEKIKIKTKKHIHTGTIKEKHKYKVDMTPDELSKMDYQKCIIFIWGMDPIIDDKEWEKQLNIYKI